jgi:hypothetical protein
VKQKPAELGTKEAGNFAFIFVFCLLSLSFWVLFLFTSPFDFWPQKPLASNFWFLTSDFLTPDS